MIFFFLGVDQATATTAAFDAWLAAPEREEIVLYEPEPSYTLLGFVNVGGATPNAYSVAWARFVETTRIPGGLYAPIIGVTEDGAALTEKASLAEVNATAGTFYWDEAAGVLYVRPTTGTPASHTMLAQIRLYFANAPVVLEHIYYHPWLTGDLPQIRREAEDLLTGATSMPSGSVTLTNGHGAWFGLVASDGQWNWKNAPAKFAIGGRAGDVVLERADYAAVGTLFVEDVAPTEINCQHLLQPQKRLTELELPITPYFEDEYPNLGDGVRGRRKWIGYGRAIIPPDLTDTSGHGVYTVADAAYQTLFAVHNVWAVSKSTGARTLLTLTTDYTVDLTLCTVTIVNAAYAHGNYTLAVDVTGKPDGVGGYLKTYGAIVRDWLETFLGVPTGNIDVAAFAQADTDADGDLAVWLPSQRSIASLLATSEPEQPSLGKTTKGTVLETAEGLWTCDIWDPFVTDITTTLRREDLALFAPKPKLKTIFSTVRVHYGYDHERQQWSVAEWNDPRIEYRTQSRDRLDLYTFLVDQSAAESLAQRYLLLAGGVTVEAEFEERGAKLALKTPRAKLALTYSPAPVVAGSYTDAPFGIQSLTVELAPKLKVSGRLGNLHNLGGKIGVWMDDGAPDYASATEAERDVSGFWTDDNGLADPADPFSGGRSLWW